MGILRANLLTHSQLQPTGSVFFDGTDDKITVIGFGNIGTSDFTLECWVYLSTTAGIQRIISANEGSQSTEYTAIRSHATHGWQGYIGTDTGWWEGHSGNDHPSWTTGWHHVVLQRFGNDGYIFVDGEYVITDQDGSSASNAADPVTVTTFVLGHGIGSEYLNAGYISNARVSMKAVYGGNDFTVPKFELQPRGDTYLLCCQSSSSSSEAAVLPRDVSNPTAGLSVTGAAASSFHPGLKKDITDTGVVFDGFTVLATSTYMVPPSGNTRERGRGRGVLGGGAPFVSPNVLNNMSYVEVQSGGIFKDFGDLTVARGQFSAGQNASSTRGLSSGGWTSPVGVNTIDFITIANTANAIDFGDTTITRPNGVLSNQTRSLTASNGDLVNTIDFVTIATTGNASDFGDLVDGRGLVSGVSSPTRGVWGGGRNNTPSSNTEHNTLQYITIASTGDAQDFGDLTRTHFGMSGFSSAIRGIFAGGYSNPQGKINSIEYFTIATLGNAIDFGDLSASQGYGGSLTNSILGLITVNSPSNYYNTIDFITISTTGNAKDFGDADPLGSGKGHGSFPSCMSDSHGGTT